MGQSRLKKYNTLFIGVISGLLLPLTIFIIIYMIRYIHVPFDQFLINLWEMKLLIKLLSLCGFANLLLFLYFYRNKMDRAAKGVISATFLYAMLVLLSRLT